MIYALISTITLGFLLFKKRLHILTLRAQTVSVNDDFKAFWIKKSRKRGLKTPNIDIQWSVPRSRKFQEEVVTGTKEYDRYSGHYGQAEVGTMIYGAPHGLAVVSPAPRVS